MYRAQNEPFIGGLQIGAFGNVIVWLIEIGITFVYAWHRVSVAIITYRVEGESTRKGKQYLIPIAVAVGAVVLVAVIALGFALLQGTSPSSAAIDHFNQGLEYQEQGEIDLAIDEYTRAIEIDPEFSQAYLNRSWAYIKQEEYDLAIADCDQAIALDPEFSGAYNNRGFAYAIQGDYTHALADLDKAITLDPNYAEAYYIRGLVYADTGELQKAINDLETALDLGLDPDAKQYAEAALEELRR